MKPLSLLRDYWHSLFHPEFWIYATWLDLITTYRKSALGLFWVLIPPVLYTFAIGYFYSLLMRQPPESFFAYLGAGYVIYRLVTSPLTECCGTFRTHASFIQDGRVRYTDYVLRIVARAIFYFLMSLPVMVVAFALSPNFHPGGLLIAVPGLLVVLMNVAWVGVVVAILGARLPDVKELMGSILMFAFLFTPILWRADLVPADSMRGLVARINPLFHLLEIVRAPLLGEPLERLTFIYLGVMTLLGWAVAYFLYRRYARYIPIWI